MELRRWNQIVAVAEHRSFARAAGHVHVTQPALTRSIQAAEAELGLRLFDRGTQEVVPTPAGEFVIERARQLLYNSRCLERDVDLYRSRALGDTAFGVGPFPVATFIPALLASIRREFPGINVRVEVNNWKLLVTRLREEDIEFFVADISDLPPDPSLHVRSLRREPGSFYVRKGHPLAGLVSVTFRQAWAFGLLSIRLPPRVLEALARMLELPSPESLKLALECDDVGILKGIALASDSVLLGPDAAFVQDVAEGRLVPVNVVGLPPLSAEMGLVSLWGRTPSPMAELIMERLPLGEAKSKAGRRR
ncbi:LysR family transcriptional regulator [Variovorax rhizosphaerae]|uniref:LysR family transcriptional regulator n=1 Tax=Variovorax rhizosphaerae TaxID=1836200 RepID=A0ABU8WK33_9BURK